MQLQRLQQQNKDDLNQEDMILGSMIDCSNQIEELFDNLIEEVPNNALLDS